MLLTQRMMPRETDIETAMNEMPQEENASAYVAEENLACDEVSVEDIYIANAGIVLATPFVPRLFSMLNLTNGGKFNDPQAVERAVHLLQFAVNESCDSPAIQLALNRVLCGVPAGVPIIRDIELLASERDGIEGMLAAIINNWAGIGTASVQSLRESFLQRAGRLQLKGDVWRLTVEPKGIDVLLDRLPWSFSVIKHPWMLRPIHVKWR